MKVTRVLISSEEGGIPLRGWGSVERALRIFSAGSAKDAMVGHEDAVDLINNPLLLADFYDRASRTSKPELLEFILTESKKSVSDFGFWNECWDYNAVGTPFFKSAVRIGRIPEEADTYYLETVYGYSRRAERWLAGELGLERGLFWKMVNISLQPQNDRFVFDFEEIFGKVGAVIDLSLTGVEMAQKYFEHEIEASGRSVLLRDKDHLQLTLPVNNIRSLQDVNSRDQWSLNGSAVSGPVLRGISRYTGEEWTLPELRFKIHRETVGRPLNKYTPPIIDADQKKMVNELILQIANQFVEDPSMIEYDNLE